MQDKVKFILLLTVAVAGFTLTAKADEAQSDYARVMNAMNNSSDDGTDPNSGAPTASNSPAVPGVQQPISIYGPQAFHQTQGANSLSSASSAGNQTFNARPGLSSNH